MMAVTRMAMSLSTTTPAIHQGQFSLLITSPLLRARRMTLASA
jgi:hypothetical protein